MKPTLRAAQLGELLVVERGQVRLADVDGAAGQRVEPGEAVHQRALARAGRAHDRRELAGLEGDRDAVEGADLAVADAVGLDGVDGTGRGPAAGRGGDDGGGLAHGLDHGPGVSRPPSPFRLIGLRPRANLRAPAAVARPVRLGGVEIRPEPPADHDAIAVTSSPRRSGRPPRRCSSSASGPRRTTTRSTRSSPRSTDASSVTSWSATSTLRDGDGERGRSSACRRSPSRPTLHGQGHRLGARARRRRARRRRRPPADRARGQPGVLRPLRLRRRPRPRHPHPPARTGRRRRPARCCA